MNTLDKVIGYFNPKAGLERAAYRRKVEILSGTRGYEGASRGRNAQSWQSQKGDADSHIRRDGQTLRDRSRDAVRNNPLAAKIITVHANNLVGPGIKPRAKTGKPEVDKKINTLYDKWAKVCHVDGTMTLDGLAYVGARMMAQDGECFIRKRTRRQSDGLPVPLQLQLLDSEFCDWNKCLVYQGNQILSGIEYDQIGRRRGYWLFPYNPQSMRIGQGNAVSNFVPASDIVHLFEPLTNQTRGVPWLSPVLADLNELRDYLIAENVRKKAEACYVGVISPAQGDLDPNIGLPEDGSDGVTPPLVDSAGNPVERMEPGMFAVAQPGSSITFNTPAISAGLEAYIRTWHRVIAAGARLPYELMTGDYSQANFASGQLGLLDYQQFIDALQWHYLIPQVMQRIYEWFLEAAVLAGEIEADLVVNVEWQPPEFTKINRLDEARADLLELRMMKRSPQQIIAKTGWDPAEVLAETDEWYGQLDKSKSQLVSDADPRKTSQNGQAQDANNPPTGGADIAAGP